MATAAVSAYPFLRDGMPIPGTASEQELMGLEALSRLQCVQNNTKSRLPWTIGRKVFDTGPIPVSNTPNLTSSLIRDEHVTEGLNKAATTQTYRTPCSWFRGPMVVRVTLDPASCTEVAKTALTSLPSASTATAGSNTIKITQSYCTLTGEPIPDKVSNRIRTVKYPGIHLVEEATTAYGNHDIAHQTNRDIMANIDQLDPKFRDAILKLAGGDQEFNSEMIYQKRSTDTDTFGKDGNIIESESIKFLKSNSGPCIPEKSKKRLDLYCPIFENSNGIALNFTKTNNTDNVTKLKIGSPAKTWCIEPGIAIRYFVEVTVTSGGAKVANFSFLKPYLIPDSVRSGGDISRIELTTESHIFDPAFVNMFQREFADQFITQTVSKTISCHQVPVGGELTVPLEDLKYILKSMTLGFYSKSATDPTNELYRDVWYRAGIPITEENYEGPIKTYDGESTPFSQCMLKKRILCMMSPLEEFSLNVQGGALVSKLNFGTSTLLSLMTGKGWAPSDDCLHINSLSVGGTEAKVFSGINLHQFGKVNATIKFKDNQQLRTIINQGGSVIRMITLVSTKFYNAGQGNAYIAYFN